MSVAFFDLNTLQWMLLAKICTSPLFHDCFSPIADHHAPVKPHKAYVIISQKANRGR